jgi:predicted protein tyrosine phosphatase
LTLDKPKLLFICSQNRWRSLTAEKIFEGSTQYQVKSAGTDPGARIRVTAGQIGWADKIFVMEKKHLQLIKQKFGDVLYGKEVFCLHIPDDYPYMDRELIELLQERLTGFIEVPG